MTLEQVCERLREAGAIEYEDSILKGRRRCFYFLEHVAGPNCDHNDRPPGLHVCCYADISYLDDHEGGVEFKAMGARTRPVEFLLHGVRRHEAVAMIPKAHRTMEVLWSAYCVEMGREA